jgi:amidophosphoribosyltransferase
MCGIAGLFLGRSRDRAAIDLLEAAFLLQHRGQDACGIASANQDGDVYRYRNLGLASEVFANPRNIQELEGHIGLLHCKLIPFQIIQKSYLLIK